METLEEDDKPFCEGSALFTEDCFRMRLRKLTREEGTISHGWKVSRIKYGPMFGLELDYFYYINAPKGRMIGFLSALFEEEEKDDVRSVLRWRLNELRDDDDDDEDGSCR